MVADGGLPADASHFAAGRAVGTPADITEAKARLDASLLEPPDRAERAIYVGPADAVADIAGKVRARLTAATA